MMEIHPLLARRPGRRFELSVLRSRALTPTTHAIEVEKPSDFTFLPTQFTLLQVGGDARPMSIATSPTRAHLEYGVRLSDSAFKRAFAALVPGDKVRVQGPLGNYILDSNRPAVLVGGGIGITPLKGMAEYASDQKLSIPVRLVYGNTHDIPYRDELDALERANPNFHVTHAPGRNVPSLLAEASRDLDAPVFYLCGGTGFVESAARSLTDAGVPNADIRYEVFRGYGTTLSP